MTKYLLVFVVLFSAPVSANEYSFKNISKRYQGVVLSKKETDKFRMQGECLVGLKELNFKKREKFDPIAEWTNYRSISLFEQFPPCQVLVMMEIARDILKEKENL